MVVVSAISSGADSGWAIVVSFDSSWNSKSKWKSDIIGKVVVVTSKVVLGWFPVFNIDFANSWTFGDSVLVVGFEVVVEETWVVVFPVG